MFFEFISRLINLLKKALLYLWYAFLLEFAADDEDGDEISE